MEARPISNFFDLQSIVVNDAVVEEYERQQEEQKRKKKENALLEHYKKQSGVNRKFWDMTIDDFCVNTENQSNAYNTVKDFIKNPMNKLLLLYGDYGTGKTMLGSTIIREIGGQYITSYRLCVEYESASDFKSLRNKLQVLDFYSQCDFLVIDEVGTDKVSLEKELLPNIINERYENELPTCIITNLTKLQIIELLGKRTYDRLTEICISVELKGNSRRQELRVC